MNGTVAPPSSRSTAARTCPVFAVMALAIRCSMLCMGPLVSCDGTFERDRPDQAVDDIKPMVVSGRRREGMGTAPRRARRRRSRQVRHQALNELPWSVGVGFGLNSLARPFNTRVLQILSCRPCLRLVQATIRTPMNMMAKARPFAG